MKITISVIFVLCLCFSAAGQAKPAAVTLYDTAFKPAEFTDPARLEKIKQTFPAIEKIYKDHATKNHFPGIAFGVVVDGKARIRG